MYTESPELDNALVNPEFWSHEEEVHQLLTWLRHNDPLRYLEPEGFAPFWNVTKYNDIKAIEGNKKVFINDPRPTLAQLGMDEMVQAMTGRRHLIRSLVQMDDPDHMKYRMLTQGWFMGANLRKLQDRVDRHRNDVYRSDGGTWRGVRFCKGCRHLVPAQGHYGDPRCA